ncbi:MAG: hypothetical protein ACMXYK_05395 [Candidatus Woesearchaeota archaeon]
MQEQQIQEALEVILENIAGKQISWRLEGSTNLKVQGVNVNVRDLDITTNIEGINSFRTALETYKIQDFFNEKVQGHTLVYDIKGVEVEITAYKDTYLEMLNKITIFS